MKYENPRRAKEPFLALFLREQTGRISQKQKCKYNPTFQDLKKKNRSLKAKDKPRFTYIILYKYIYENTVTYFIIQ